MSIVKVKYDLTDPDDRIEHLQAVNASNMALLIWQFWYNTRKEFEYLIDGKKLSSDELFDKIYEKFGDLLLEYHIDIDQLVV